jgi:AcrR family transcriptional regulator
VSLPDPSEAAAAPPRGRPRSTEAERAILDATVALYAERGMAGLSVEAVAARAGVAKTTIYRRWPAKEELVLAAVTAARGPLVEPPGSSVRGDLLFLLGRVRVASSSWPALMNRLTTEADEFPELAAEAWRRAIGPRRALLAGVLHRGVDEGLIRPDADLDLVADMLVAPAVGKVRLDRRPLDDVQLAFLVDTVLRGLAP